MPDTFAAEQTPKTPFLNFNAEAGVLEMKGKSIPENSILFYKPVFDWLDNYMQNPAKATTLNIQFDYFNTSSAKILADLFKKLETFNNTGKSPVVVNWHYQVDDDDMLEAGEDYKSISKIPFNTISFQ